MGGLKSPLAEFGAHNGSWPTGFVAPGSTPTATQMVATTTGKYVTLGTGSIGAYPAGTITATISSGQAKNGTITMVTADGGATWNCSGGNVAMQYRPQACRS